MIILGRGVSGYEVEYVIEVANDVLKRAMVGEYFHVARFQTIYDLLMAGF